MVATGHYIVESDISNWTDIISATHTFATIDVSVVNNTIVVSLDISTGSRIIFTSTGILPLPLVYGQVYYAIRTNATTIKVALDPITAAAGIAIDLTTVGVGTHTVDVGEGSSEVARQEAIDRAEQLIESVTKDFFYAKNFEVILDGNGRDRIFLGLTANILSITKIELYDVELDESFYAFDNRFVYLDPSEADPGNLVELHYLMKQSNVLFPAGTGNIKVTGTCGRNLCPPAIKKAAVILCESENDPTLYQRYGHFTTESVNDYSYHRSEKFMTGVVEADRLITPYIKRKPMFGML